MNAVYAPGTVAMVTGRLTGPAVRILSDTVNGRRWWGPSGYLAVVDVTDVHPLVVIDPENRAQVERLVVAHCRAYCCDPAPLQPEEVAIMQAALREFANPQPPKPEEPTGLGAVVEDTKGAKHVRAGITHGGTMRDAWRQVTGNNIGNWAHYAEITVVRVLSEGVTL